MLRDLDKQMLVELLSYAYFARTQSDDPALQLAGQSIQLGLAFQEFIHTDSDIASDATSLNISPIGGDFFERGVNRCELGLKPFNMSGCGKPVFFALLVKHPVRPPGCT